MNPALYAIRKETISWLAVLLLLVGGYLAFNSLGRYEDPAFVIRQAVVITPYPGASALQVAEEVTDPIEAAIQQLQEVKQITSISRPGESEVQVEIQMRFAPEQGDLEQIWDKMRHKIADAQTRLPPGAGPSLVNDDFGDVYALFLAVTGSEYSLVELADYAEDLRKELLLVDGVAKVSFFGAPREALFLEVSRASAARYGVSLEQVYEQLRRQTAITPAGSAVVDTARVRVSPGDSSPSLEALRELLVTVDQDAGLVTLGDIANLALGVADPPRALMRHDGRPAVGIGISNVSGGNVVRMGELVDRRLAELESSRPLGMDLHVVSHQGQSVQESVNSFLANLIAAIAIVVGVLLLFMGLRSGLIIGGVLLLIVAGTLIAMALDGIDMHRVSLGALIIALGMLVDNAIVVTDAMLERIRAGEDRLTVAKEVVGTTIWPLLGGTVVGILAFSAIGFSPTGMGEYAGSLFWVIAYSLFLSWLLAVTITPLLCWRFIPAPKGNQTITPYQGFVYGGYRFLLLALLRRPFLSVAILLMLLGLALFGARYVPPGFMPDSTRPQFVVDYWLPQGTDIAATSEGLRRVEEVVQGKPGVQAVTSFIGSGGLRFMLTYSPEPANTAYGQLLVDVTDYKVLEHLIPKLQHELDMAFPEAKIKAWKFMLGKPLPSKIEAQFRGPDPQVLRELAGQAKAIMLADPDAVGIQDNWREQVPTIRPLVNEAAARRAGVSSADINTALLTALDGKQIGVYRDGNKLIPMIVRYPETSRSRLVDLETVLVTSKVSGLTVPLAQFVTGFATVFEDTLIRRQDRFPTIKAQCDPPAGEIAGPLFQRLRPQIEAIDLPPGYDLSWEGEYEAARESNQGLAVSAPYGFAAMILAVVLMFNALRQPLVIWLTAPLALIGVTVGLLVFRTPFEFMAILGFLSLIGLLVKNAIVLVDQIDLERSVGKPLRLAIVESSVSRMRPVAMGALTTILGVAPLLFDPFFKSMTVVIMFGLGFATLLTLLVVPVFYLLFFQDRESRAA
ncbi:MAG: efflux RND transporter permease subunit [Desulfovibrionales bacterium]|nr:MAG: efflux RND transporter permease subunit [Desulfovibrionales bacterium]